MNIINNPNLLDQLAAGYALGTLRGGARRRFETLARQSATVRASALIWQERFASMTELQAADVPSPNVWKRIENLVKAQPAAAAAPVPDTGLLDALRRALGLWRGAALAGGLATVAAVASEMVPDLTAATSSGAACFWIFSMATTWLALRRAARAMA